MALDASLVAAACLILGVLFGFAAIFIASDPTPVKARAVAVILCAALCAAVVLLGVFAVRRVLGPLVRRRPR